MKNIEKLIEFALNLISDNTGKSLSYIQKAVLQESLSDIKKTYEQIAQEYGYSENYIKQGVAPKLWQLLSESLREKVNRTNCRALLEKQLENSQFLKILIPPNIPQKLCLEYSEKYVPLDSPLYIQRDIEQLCYQEILRSSAFIHIQAPRKMGKTSLVKRILAYGSFHNYYPVYLSLYSAEIQIFSSSDKFLKWFCSNVTQQLGLESKLKEYWNEDIGNLTSCTTYFQSYLIEKISTPIILALDELNVLFEYPDVARDFFALLHYWHDKTKDVGLWQKLRLIIAHTDIYILLRNQRALLNGSLVIELTPFNQREVEDLVKRYNLKLKDSELERLMQLTGGFPYLLRLALYDCLYKNIPLENILQNVIQDNSIFINHLHEQLWCLKQDSGLATAFQKVINKNSAVKLDTEIAFKLKNFGFVHLQGNKATVSCELYREYFRDYFL